MKIHLGLFLVIGPAMMFAGGAYAESASGSSSEPGFFERLENSVFGWSNDESAEGREKAAAAQLESGDNADTRPSQPADDDDFKSGRADLSGDSSDASPAPTNDADDKSGSYIPDAGDSSPKDHAPS